MSPDGEGDRGDASGSPDGDGDRGDASGSPGCSARIATSQGAMPAPRRCSVNVGTPASTPQAPTPIETSKRPEIAGGTSRAEAALDEGAAPTTSMPGTDSVPFLYSGLGREIPMMLEKAATGTSSTAASDEAAGTLTSIPVRYSALGRGFQLGTVPVELLNGGDGFGDRISEIWRDDVSEAFDEIRAQMQDHENSCNLIGIDTEFCRLDVTLDRVPPAYTEAYYLQTRRIVDGGDLVQVGMAFGNSENSFGAVYQFNLQFDPASRDTMSPNIAFLRDTAKLDLDGHCTRGIDPSTFFQLLTESELLKNTNISWITYQGYVDFGYLIRGLENIAALPLDRRQFLALVYKYFPRSIDLKIFHMKGICCNAPVRGVRGSGSRHRLLQRFLVSIDCDV